MCTSPKYILHPQVSFYSYLGGEFFYNGVSCTSSSSFLFQKLSELVALSPDSAFEICHSSFIIYKKIRIPLFVTLSCGRCAECRYSLSRDIESRALVEASFSGTVIFYTLTYSSEHLPPFGLEKSHVSESFKRLRTHISRYLDFPITFTNLYVGEYGTDPRRTLRPHYHGLLFIKERLTPTQIYRFQQFFRGTRSDCLSHKLRYLPCIYDEPELSGVSHWWPFGCRFDFEQPKFGVSALVRYCCKYITKSYITTSTSFAVNRERFESHYNPCFVQLPKRFGLGTRYLPDLLPSILNSNNLSLRLNCHGKLITTPVPRIFISKIFPPLSSVYPSAAFHVSLVHRLIDIIMKTDKDEGCRLLDVLSPFKYLCSFKLRRSQVNRLNISIAFLSELSVVKLISICESYISELHNLNCYTSDKFLEVAASKSEFFRSHCSDDVSVDSILNNSKNMFDIHLNYVNTKMIDSIW